jgi:hypothetical protein
MQHYKNKIMEHYYYNLDGWMGKNNIDLFNFVIEKIPTNFVWVEVGSWAGKSISYCVVELTNKNKFGKFSCVDIWEDVTHIKISKHETKEIHIKDLFLQNIKPIENKVEIIQSLSWDASSKFLDNTLDFCYLDAAHDYDSVSKDLEAWWPKIKEGSYFGGDDYSKDWPDVPAAVNNFFNEKNITINTIGRCWFVQKN